MAADGKRWGFGLSEMRGWWAAQAARLSWPTHAMLFTAAAFVGYGVYFDDHSFLAIHTAFNGATPATAGVLAAGLAAAGWLGLTHAALYRLNPPDPDRAVPPGIFGALRDRLWIMGPPLLSFITLIAIIWYGYSHTLPRLMHVFSQKTPASATMTMNGDYKFDGSPACATATGYVEDYGFVTVCLPETLRDRVDGHYGVQMELDGLASRWGLGVKGISPK